MRRDIGIPIGAATGVRAPLGIAVPEQQPKTTQDEDKLGSRQPMFKTEKNPMSPEGPFFEKPLIGDVTRGAQGISGTNFF